MKPFALDAVLSYRKRLKDLARNRYHEARNQQNLCAARLDLKTQEYQELVDTLAQRQLAGMDILEHIRFDRRIELVQTEISRLREQLRRKQEIVIRERAHLLQKSKEQRVMEKLKEQQNRAWQEFLTKKEAAMLDEIAALNHQN